MEKQLDGMLDIAIMVVIMAMGITTTAASLRDAERSAAAEIREKTVVAANDNNTPAKPFLSGKDVLLPLAVQDSALPPKTDGTYTRYVRAEDNSAFESGDLVKVKVKVTQIGYNGRQRFAARAVSLNLPKLDFELAGRVR